MRYLKHVILLGLYYVTSVSHPSFALAKEPLKVGLTLSGGSAAGFGHIAVLELLDELGIKVSYITGTSMGAVIGALYAVGYSGKEIEAIVSNSDFGKLFDDRPRFENVALENKANFGKYMFRLPLNKLEKFLPSGLISGQELWLHLAELFQHVSTTSDFSKFPIPFKAIATDLEGGRAVVLSKGYLPDALRASIGIPYIFRPIRLNSKTLVDGGLVKNFPVSVTKASGANFNIGSRTWTSKDPKQLDSALGIFFHMLSYENMRELPKDIQACDLYIDLSLDNVRQTLNFSPVNIKKIIARARKLLKKYHPEFQALAARTQQERPLPVAREQRQGEEKKFYVSAIEAEGLAAAQAREFIKTLEISPGHFYSIKQINSVVREVLGKMFYQDISYNFEHDPQGRPTVLKFHATEVKSRYLEGGVFFNNKLKTVLRLSMVYKGLINKRSSTRLSFDIGKYPVAEIQNRFYPRSFPPNMFLGLSTGYHYELVKPSLVKNFEAEFDNAQLAPSIQKNLVNCTARVFLSKARNLGFGVPLSLLYVYNALDVLNKESSSTLNMLNKSLFVSLGLESLYDSRDSKTLATRGIYFRAKIGFVKSIYNHYGSATSGATSLTTDIKAKETIGKVFASTVAAIKSLESLEIFIPLSKGLNATLGADLGFNINFGTSNNRHNVSQLFVVGGVDAHTLTNQVTFLGLSDGALLANNLIKLSFGLQYTYFKPICVGLAANYLRYNNSNSVGRLFSTNMPGPQSGSVIGSGVSLTYLTQLGPIKLTIMHNWRTMHPELYFSIGSN